MPVLAARTRNKADNGAFALATLFHNQIAKVLFGQNEWVPVLVVRDNVVNLICRRVYDR
jgi:hypothetical protein